jgi:DNA ligase-1
MKFSQFAEQLDKLEKTTKRLELVDLLSGLFKQAHQQEIQSMVYLCQGRLAPFFEPIEIGMGEKLVAQSIAQAAGQTADQAWARFSQLGDLGLVAQEMITAEDSGISLKQVFDGLNTIATTEGAGSISQKVSLLSQLLSEVGPLGAKHLARIPVGALRLGIGDPTLLDAFSMAKVGDKSLRPALERAYNETSDLGMIADVLWKQGIEGVNALQVSVGRPLRSQLTERLPNPLKVIEKLGTVAVQTKYDGFRVQIHKQGPKVEIYSRNLEDMTQMFPDIIAGVLQQTKAETAIFDGEAIAYNEDSGEFYPFQETTKRRRKHGVADAAVSLPLKAFIFDCLYVDGQSLLELPYTERLDRLSKVIEPGNVLSVSETEMVDTPDRLEALLNEAITEGLEGVVVKRPDSPYQAGARNFNWVKLKRHSSGELNDTIDCVVLGYIYGRGKRTAFGAGALLVGVYDVDADEFKSVSKIGTGLSDKEWQEIHSRCDIIATTSKPARVDSTIIPSVWVEPEVVIEVLADEITRSPSHTAGKVNGQPGYALRFPRLVSFREGDKKAEDATSVKELVQLFNQQGAK